MRTSTRTDRRALAAAAAIAVALGGCGSSDDDKPALPSAEAGLERKIETAEKAAKAKPADPEPLAQIAKARFQLAGLKNDSTGAFDDDGKAELRRATKAWERYLALDPQPLDTGVAQLIAAAYGPGSLDDPKKAVEVQQILAQNTRPPRASLYAQLARMAYYAGERQTAEQAADRAIELSPRRARKAMRRQLATARQAAP